MINKDEEPIFMLFVRDHASKEGITVKEFLERDRRRAENPEYPTEECIAPDTAQGLVDLGQGKDPKVPLDWLEAAKRHVRGCAYCQVYVAGMTTLLSPPK